MIADFQTMESAQTSDDELLAVKEQFFRRMLPGSFTQLFTGLTGVTFFIKDLEGRFMGLSSSDRLGLDFGGESAVIGRTDHDLYPAGIADRIAADDQRVIETQESLLNIVELLINPKRNAFGWYVTNKFPVFDGDGAVHGIMGTVQPYEGRRKRLLDGTRLDEVVERIRHNPMDAGNVEDLAQMACMSSRQLARHFQAVLGMSPRDFRLICRVQIACDQLVNLHIPIGRIAQNIGFYDQSAFAVQFRRRIGMSPLEYRQRYQNASAAHKTV